MTRQAFASTARALVALLAAVPPVTAQEPPPAAAAEPELLVRIGKAPVVDGRIEAAEWEGATEFNVERGETYGHGRILRAGRQLYVAFETVLPPWEIGLRLKFVDPVSGRSNLVLVTPVSPPRPPMTAFRTLVGRKAERVSSSECDIRFVFLESGFSCEMRLPLDLLEIAPADKVYAFSLEMWALTEDRAIAAYPQDERAGTVLARPAVLKSEGAWGADERRVDAPPANGVLAFLEKIVQETEDGPVFPRDAGWISGQRKDAALEALEAEAMRLIEACPDAMSVRSFLVQVRIARNDLEGALAALDEQDGFLPPFAKEPGNRLVRMRVLRDLGRYDDALAMPAGPEDPPGIVDARNALAGLRDAWRVEGLIRKAEAERNDLPRVRLETSKGTIDLELFEDDAPNGVADFVSLVESGFYDGTRFHWVAGGDRAVGGDPNSKDDDPHNDGYGDPGYMIESEPGRRTVFPMSLSLTDKRRQRRTEGSAFAIHLSPDPFADGINTVLGRVIAGEDVVRRLEHYDTLKKATVLRKRDHPYTPIKR